MVLMGPSQALWKVASLANWCDFGCIQASQFEFE